MIQIRKASYRGQEGYLICGRLPSESSNRRSRRIFVSDYEVAQEIKAKIRAGKDWDLLDYYGNGEAIP